MAVSLGLRPRLTFDVPGDAASLAERIRGAEAPYSVMAAGTYLVIKIPEQDQHYWSPQLQVELEDQAGTVHVRGLFTPMPAVWTLFACVYGSILTLGLFGTIFGLAQLQLGMPAVALWTFPIALVLIGCVYAAAMIGQRIGHKQTEELTAFLHRCLEG